jgi:gamma-tubulin complex component 5
MSVPFLRLAQVVSNVDPQLLSNPFSHLEALFEQTTLAQMTLEDDVFKYMSEIFFECLQTYLKPIRRWMEAGELGTKEETFFVFASDTGSDAVSLWHDRYVLRRDGQQKLRSPSFLQPAAAKIFNTGKSVVFLKELGIYDTDSHALELEPRLDHETVCGASGDVPISPFPELFQAAFETWIRSKYSVASAVLRQHIFQTDGLMRNLTIFETLYLSKNGAVFEDFATAIFERMDARRRGWSDRYVLTELARGIFGIVLAASDAEKIVVRTVKAKNKKYSVVGLAAISVDFAVGVH